MIVENDIALTSLAFFSECRRFRYQLRRCFDGSIAEPPRKPVTFIMLNPSTADAFVNDPTIRRCIGFAQAWGYTDLIVANLFAIRETDSKKLKSYPDRVGSENDAMLAQLGKHGPMIAAWGAHPLAVTRARAVQLIVGQPLQCLRKTKSGAPEHPLYIPANTCPQPWEPQP